MGVSVSYKYLNEDHALIGVWVIRYKYKKAMPEWGFELGIGKRSISKMRGTCTKNIFIQK